MATSTKLNETLTQIGIAFALYWICLGLVYPFELLKSSPITYYLYLPSGIKLFTVLIFKWRAVIGVAIASSMRLIYGDPTQPWVAWVVIATTAVLSIYLVVEAILRFLKIEDDLSNLGYYQIVLIAVVTSVVNGFVFAYGVSYLTDTHFPGTVFQRGYLAAMGNFVGNAVFVCTMVLIVRHKSEIMNFLRKIQS